MATNCFQKGALEALFIQTHFNFVINFKMLQILSSKNSPRIKKSTLFSIGRGGGEGRDAWNAEECPGILE